MFEKTAREWTSKHAKGTSDPEFGLDKAAIKRIVDMGFGREMVVDALIKAEGNEQGAIELILNN